MRPGDATWQERRTAFGPVAAAYAAFRPGYPPEAVRAVLGDRPLRVADVGAGTGLFTDALLAAGHDVVAVEPDPGMLAQLRERLPRVDAREGGAEALPLPDADVDAVVAGQAAHWFDPVPAAAEMRRVLRPGGVVGLVWNTRDERVPWVRALGDLLAGEARDHAADQSVTDALARELDAEVQVSDSGVVQRVTPEEVVGGIGTRSYVATMTPEARELFLGRIRRLLAEHPDTRGRALLELPYTTRAYRLTPAPPAG